MTGSVTPVPRTLLDLAEVLTPRGYGARTRRPLAFELLDVRAIERRLRGPTAGAGSVAYVTLGYDPAPATQTRSEAERLFLDLVRDAGLPIPAVNVLVEGFLVDAYYLRRDS